MAKQDQIRRDLRVDFLITKRKYSIKQRRLMGLLVRFDLNACNMGCFALSKHSDFKPTLEYAYACLFSNVRSEFSRLL